MYKLLRPILFRADAERMHEIVTVLGPIVPKRVLHALYGYEHPSLRQKLWGLDFPNPVGLAAGFDKNAKLVDVLPKLGFGFVEVGTVTPKAQPGNLKPRLFHVEGSKALINRMGFNNDGVDTVYGRLAARKGNCIVGVNIGKNKGTPNEQAIEDYVICFQKLKDVADYIVINVSSPNTPGLRELQAKDFLQNMITELQTRNENKKPIVLKISPDLSNAQLDDIIGVARETQLAGVVATNTMQIEEGGLSGAPLRKRSTEVIRYLHEKAGGSFVIIGVGGMFSAKDAHEKITAGASLVQVYTGLIYEGPGLIKQIKQGLV
jgi:dihydroorotate dehydrogenase